MLKLEIEEILSVVICCTVQSDQNKLMWILY
jgi:hypothetical protein